jgi:hypothetical protein
MASLHSTKEKGQFPMSEPILYKVIQTFFQKNNCVLLTTREQYKNTRQNLDYICICGNRSATPWFCFKKGVRCKKCGDKRTGDSQRTPYNKIQLYFRKHHCILLSDSYINGRRKLKYRCSCGNVSFTTFHAFKLGHRCAKCGALKISRSRMLPFKTISNLINKIGYKFQDPVHWGCHAKIKLICNNGHLVSMSYSVLKKGGRCKTCHLERNKGQNHPLWNPNLTDEERKRQRHYPEYYEWRRNVYHRDNFTCQITGQRGVELEAHHLNGYGWAKNERADVNNGVTLAKNIHKLFHQRYGRSNNTRGQFEAFKEWFLQSRSTP